MFINNNNNKKREMSRVGNVKKTKQQLSYII